MKYYWVLAILGLAPLVGPPAQAADANHVVQLLTTNRCPNCDLRGADLAGLNLHGAQLQDADLTGANLNLVNFSKADLRGAKLSWTSLVFTDFTNAILDDVNFVGARFQGGDQLGVARSLHRAILPNERQAHSLEPTPNSSELPTEETPELAPEPIPPAVEESLEGPTLP